MLKHVNLEIDEGVTVSISGPSGSGKSSLLALIGGIERPTSGQILIGDDNFDQMTEDQLALFRRRNIGILFQSFHLLPTMTALDNASLPLELIEESDARDKARAMLDRLGLGHRLNHYPSQLSGGEQQRVALARAVIHQPKLLLADEPTGNLDQSTGRSIVDLMFQLQEEHGMTLVLITHDPQLAAQCSLKLVMDEGRLVPMSANPVESLAS